MSEKVNKAYLTNKVDGILDPMVTKILLSETVDHVQFFLDYLSENHGKRPAINTNERMELEFLRKENAALFAKL